MKIFNFYWWKKIIGFPRDWCLNIKWFIQRGQRGFADCDVWDFDNYLARIISNGCKQLKKNNNHSLDDGILEKIIYTFEAEEKITQMDWIYCKETDRKKFEKLSKNCDFLYLMNKEECEKVREGWNLFRKYFNQLWD
jgi:predicted N-acyltransferase